ncbi:hypothetical protein [Niabella hibiscisoli]|uniref:hypothetical protein n=1 Tax=Niabella hibiscisoli TaxID=1825928 RepID=UPI001F0F9C57|nr:hypothetical protein [Niabella hibiscisoli]MCH5719345.1 hypothetical protein [Niabella hibiscisoli]
MKPIFFLCALFTLILTGCKKNNTYRDEMPSNAQYPYSVYEYLQNQATGFDSLLFIINRSGLKDTLASKDVTFLQPRMPA